MSRGSNQLNDVVLNALNAKSGILPAGIDIVTFDGSPAFFANYNYDFSITEGLQTVDGGGIPGLYIGVITTAAVPEPSTWAMMLAGFAALGWAGYRAGRKRISFVA